jgi:hypothetical protein
LWHKVVGCIVVVHRLIKPLPVQLQLKVESPALMGGIEQVAIFKLDLDYLKEVLDYCSQEVGIDVSSSY